MKITYKTVLETFYKSVKVTYAEFINISKFLTDFDYTVKNGVIKVIALRTELIDLGYAKG